MKLSRYFLPVLKEAPREAKIISHQLMLRAGMIKQASAGIYSWLPLGLKVLRNIETIVREEQARAGAVEMLMPTIQPADLWRESGRYDDYGEEMLRIKDRHERDMLYGPTNEELITDIFRQTVKSYKQLPLNLYHIQWKFRDEIRPRFGVMRGREFLMKDGYSFDVDGEAGRKSYQKMFVSYLRTYQRLGLKALPVKAEAGPIGGELSHEFIILTETGESQVFCHKDMIELEAPPADIDYEGDLGDVIEQWTTPYAATEEIHDAKKFDLEVPADKQASTRGIEVGHIFFFGDKYSKPMEALVQREDGRRVAVQCGSYGIGISRLVGAIIEASHDDNGIIWPEAVAPFKVGLINLRTGDVATDKVCTDLYEKFCTAGIEVLYDDTDERAGGKFSTMDLIGLPWQLVVGPKGLAQGVVELKCRRTGKRESLSGDAAFNKLAEG